MSAFAETKLTRPGGDRVADLAIVLGALAMGALFFVADLIGLPRAFLDQRGELRIAEDHFEDYREKLPELLAFNRGVFNNGAQAAVEAEITAQLDAAFEPVFAQVGAYADFHYSMLGQYSELATLVAGDFSATLEARLFGAVDFESRITVAQTAIDARAEDAIATALGAFRREMRATLAYGPREMRAIAQVAVLSQRDALERISSYAPLRFGAAAVGAIAVNRGMRALTGAFATRLSGAAATKLATGRVAGAGAGGASGAVLGPLGAVAGFVIGWVVADQIVIKLDEVINREAFEAEIRQMITQQKDAYRSQLLDGYALVFADIVAENDIQLRTAKPAPRMIDVIRR